MKKFILWLLLACLLCPLMCACGKEEELGPWQMPAVDARPTPTPTEAPAFGGGSPESYVWNEAAFLRMNDPGAAPDSVSAKGTHKQVMALFPYNFLPTTIFGESYAAWEKLTLRKTEHEVMLSPEAVALAEHAYVEFRFLPKSGREEEGLFVMAELCSYDAALEIYNGSYPHLIMPEGEGIRLSTYYLKDFVLAKVGEQRVAQILKLTPSSYFLDARRAMAEDEGFVPARQILLTLTCGLGMSDEEFVAAVCALLRYSDGSEIITPEPSRLPAKGEKGAA